MNKNTGLFAGLLAAGLASAASADVVYTYGFSRITSNAAENIASQLSVEVRAAALTSTYAEFTFRNLVGTASNVTEIYFDDGSLFGISSVTQGSTGSEPAFSTGSVSPPDLPGGETLSPAFVTTAGFAVDSASGPSNGLNQAADWVTIRFELLSGKTFADTLAALERPTPHVTEPDNWLRIGMHVRSIGTGAQSDGFVNTLLVPLPPAAWAGLGTLAAAFAAGAIRRRRMVH